MQTKNKYHAQKTRFQNIVFDSKIEAQRYIVLLNEQRWGNISNLQRQVTYELFPQWKKAGKIYKRATTYIADFTYQKGEDIVVEDVKGVETPVFKLKEVAMHFIHHIDIRKVRKATEEV